jgi:hypothetical protein
MTIDTSASLRQMETRIVNPDTTTAKTEETKTEAKAEAKIEDKVERSGAKDVEQAKQNEGKISGFRKSLAGKIDSAGGILGAAAGLISAIPGLYAGAAGGALAGAAIGAGIAVGVGALTTTGVMPFLGAVMAGGSLAAKTGMVVGGAATGYGAVKLSNKLVNTVSKVAQRIVGGKDTVEKEEKEPRKSFFGEKTLKSAAGGSGLISGAIGGAALGGGAVAAGNLFKGAAAAILAFSKTLSISAAMAAGGPILAGVGTAALVGAAVMGVAGGYGGKELVEDIGTLVDKGVKMVKGGSEYVKDKIETKTEKQEPGVPQNA